MIMKNLKQLATLFSLLLFVSVTAFAGSGVTNPKPDDSIRTIQMKGTDQMKFDVTEIAAAPGERIRIVLTTVSRIPKAAMAHNVVVLDKGADANAYANAAAMAADNEYLAPGLEDQVIAATGLAGGGETVEVTFTVPEDSGEYEFICSFPGHYMAGMKGILTVAQPAS